MCGIAGYVRSIGQASPEMILGMTRAMRHRGPDDEGLTLIDPQQQKLVDLTTRESAAGLAMPQAMAAETTREFPHAIALGHRRFSILDITPAGHQPFWDADRTICVCFNGEIYNYLELRRELEAGGGRFHTRCDTEVLVEAFRQWDVGCFERFIGFWAIALYDTRRRRLLLSRDRLGKAPLYLARWQGGTYFASEIAAILAATGRNAFGIRNDAVSGFITSSFRDVYDHTFYQGIDTFPAASFAWIDPDKPTAAIDPRRFWNLPTSRMREREISIPQAISQFRSRLASAVGLRLRADVPIGFELSGGLDSSCLVAAAAQADCPVHAYTVSFPNSDANEEPFARLVAQRYPSLVQYTVLEPPADDFWQQADEYVGVMGEPFHAPNVLANRNIWRDMSRRGIRVSINGAAGDESWAGYFNDFYTPFLRYLAQHDQWRQLITNCRLFGPEPHGWTSPTFWRRLLGAVAPVAANAVGHDPSALITSTPGSRAFVLSAADNPIRLSWSPPAGPRADLEGLMQDLMGTWRMNYWLRVANQSFMSVPTEIRCPFLDHRLVELAFTLPVTYLIRDGWLKWLVRVAMADALPSEVAWRKRKMGFPFPYHQWAVASKQRFLTMVRSLDCPYVDQVRLRRVYDSLATSNPLFLWRVMSLCLWWKKCVLGEPLV